MPERVVSSNESSTSPTADGNEEAKKQQMPSATDLGKRVLFYNSTDKKEKYGTLRYWGTPEFAPGLWCGIELDDATGKNNGSVQGIRYFLCPPNRGLFIPLGRVELDTRSTRQRSTQLDKQKKVSGNRGSPLFYNTLPRSSSIPALNQIGTRSATVSSRRDLNSTPPSSKKLSSPQRFVMSQKKQTDMSTRKSSNQDGYTSALSSASKHKFVSEANIRDKLKKDGGTTGSRRYRKALASYSDTPLDSPDDSTILRTSTSYSNISKAVFPRMSTPYDSEDSQSLYSSASDVSRHTSDSDPTPHSSSVSPDLDACILNDSDSAFLLTPLQSQVLSSPDSSPLHKPVIPFGLPTAATNLIEVSRTNGSIGEYRGPSPEGPLSVQKKYQNFPNGCTLEHPLNSAHKPTHNEETFLVDLSSKEHSLGNGVGHHGNQRELGNSPLQELQAQLESCINQQAHSESRIKKLEDSLERTQENFKDMLLQAQDSYQKQMEEIHLSYKKQMEELSVKYVQELQVLYKENLEAVNDLKKDLYRIDRLSQD